MIVKIDEDEWYPVYSADDASMEYSWGKESEMTDADWIEYQRVSKEFGEWQSKLAKLYENGKEME